MLTRSLRTLERDGLLERRITAEVPVHVDYELATLGHSLQPVTWAEDRMNAVFAAPACYDGEPA